MVINRGLLRISILVAIILTLLAVGSVAVRAPKPPKPTGVLWVYNSDGTSRPPNPSGTPPGSIDVIPGETITFQIRNITEFSIIQMITVQIQFNITNISCKATWLLNVSLHIDTTGLKTDNLTWTVGIFDNGDYRSAMQYCMTGIVVYGIDEPYYHSQNQLQTPSGGHLHVIPEAPLGTITITLTMIGGLGIFALKRKRF